MPDEQITLSEKEARKLEEIRLERFRSEKGPKKTDSDYTQKKLAERAKISEDQYKRFIGTKVTGRYFALEKHEIKNIATALGIQPTDFIDADKWQGNNIKQYTQIFDLTIKEKRKRFIGRKFVFDAIQEFQKDNTKGYFILEGDPGSGKSSVAAYYVEDIIRKDCVYYFNNYGSGPNRADQFIENICGQLIERYKNKINPPDLKSNYTKDGVTLANLLIDISSQLSGEEKLIIVVDALDEVHLDSQPEGTNILYLPDILPEKVYFFLTRRSESNSHRIPYRSPFTIMNFNEFKNESEKDIKDYIEQCFKDPEFQIGLNKFVAENSDKDKNYDENKKKIIEELTKKSQCNFMYLHYVIPQIGEKNGYYQTLNIEQLPTGLYNYYRDHWLRMGMQRTPLPETKIKLIYLICECNKTHESFVPIKLLAEFAEVKESEVQEVISEWSQFLHYQIVNNVKWYGFYHKSFHDFLFEQDIIKAANINTTKLNEEMAEKLMNAGYGGA